MLAIYLVERRTDAVMKHFERGAALDSALKSQRAQAEAAVTLLQQRDTRHVLSFPL
jgi:hypothetical protein